MPTNQNTPNILRLSLKRRWLEQIKSGEKTIEYRLANRVGHKAVLETTYMGMTRLLEKGL